MFQQIIALFFVLWVAGKHCGIQRDKMSYCAQQHQKNRKKIQDTRNNHTRIRTTANAQVSSYLDSAWVWRSTDRLINRVSKLLCWSVKLARRVILVHLSWSDHGPVKQSSWWILCSEWWKWIGWWKENSWESYLAGGCLPERSDNREKRISADEEKWMNQIAADKESWSDEGSIWEWQWCRTMSRKVLKVLVMTVEFHLDQEQKTGFRSLCLMVFLVTVSVARGKCMPFKHFMSQH